MVTNCMKACISIQSHARSLGVEKLGIAEFSWEGIFINKINLIL